MRIVPWTVVALACVLLGGCPGRGGGTDETGALDLIVAPDDGTGGIVGAIRGARRRVLLEIYMLTDDGALDALVQAHTGGCEVRVLLEPEPYGAESANDAAFATLAEAGVDVRWATSPGGLVHEKLLVVDDRIAYVMTMNFTAAGLGRNREYAIGDRDATDVARAEAIFNADAVGAPAAGAAGGHVLASPIDARPRLAAAIDGARASIAIEIEELSDGDMVAHLEDARARGVALDVVTPASGVSPAMRAALGRLVAAGATVTALDSPTIHAKTMVVDGAWLYVGSVNLTRASLDDNRELGVLFRDPAAAARVRATIAADAAHGVRL